MSLNSKGITAVRGIRPRVPGMGNHDAFKVKLLRNVDSGSGSAKTTAKGLDTSLLIIKGLCGMN